VYDVAPDHIPALKAGILAIAGMLTGLFVARRWPMRLTTAALRHYDAVPPAAQLAAGLMCISGVVHLALIGGHTNEAPTTAILFMVNGVGFLALSLAVFTPRRWRTAAALWLLATLGAYMVWNIAGRETPDQVGIGAALMELFALGLIMKLSELRPYSWPRRAWRASRLAVMTLTLTIGVWIGGVAHPGAQHAHFGAVLQAVPDQATPDQVKAADDLLARTRTSLARYADPAAAEAAGFHGTPTAFDKLVHYTNSHNDGVILDPNNPQALVYAHGSSGWVLVGAMFQMPALGQTGPDPGGPLTQWHSHEGICLSPLGGWSLALQTPFWMCPVTAITVHTPPMLHIWIVDNPTGGAFAAELDSTVVERLGK
jgi:hypothetical protein